MNWKYFKKICFIDTRAAFVSKVRKGGNFLDIGSADGETLMHIHQLRSDLNLYAIDIIDPLGIYPPGSFFQKCDIESEALPWDDESFDAIACMHIVEHLESLDNLISESYRTLKPGGRMYIETPSPKTLVVDSIKGKNAGAFTLNFFDDISHKKVVPSGALANNFALHGFNVVDSGVSRNWLFALSWPLFYFLPHSRKKWTAYVHYLGWSRYIILERIAARN